MIDFVSYFDYIKTILSEYKQFHFLIYFVYTFVRVGILPESHFVKALFTCSSHKAIIDVT